MLTKKILVEDNGRSMPLNKGEKTFSQQYFLTNK